MSTIPKIMRTNKEAYGIFYYDKGAWRGPYLDEVFTSEGTCKEVIKHDRRVLRKRTRIMKTRTNWRNA